MRQRAFTVTMVAFLVASAFAGPVGATAAAASTSDHRASVSFSGGTSGGSTVVVDEVTLPEGGFVTIHDDTLTDGDVLGSVVGTSAYLEAGTHENVTVRLTDSVDDGTYHAMAHQDTNGDRAYTFVSSNGETDGPYTVDGDIVMDSADVTVSASVAFSGQPGEGEYVIVDRVELSEAGFVTVHDSSVLDGAVFDSIRGSKYLEAGVHENVRIQLDEPLQNDDTLVPMAHRDSNDNGEYDFETSEGEADGPFLDDGGNAVVDSGQVELSDEAQTSFSAQASGGNTVVVDEVYLPEGGFVTMHDSSLADDAVFESIRGTSDYLEPGIHRNVEITLDEPLAEDDTLFAMAHRDTNENRAYDFPSSEGEEDGPYTTDSGEIVMDDGEVTVAASVGFEDQSSDGTTVVVEDVDLAEGGFVTVHDASLAEGAVIESVRGTSDYLEAGHHEEVAIQLDEPISDTHQLLAMAHRDTNGNQAYDFVDSGGETDGPYAADGNIVMTQATVQVTAHVVADTEASDGETIVVEEVTLHDGGFVTVHDSTLLNGDVFESVRGTSDYLEPGTHENVEITLDEPLEDDDTVYAMAHRDTNNNRAYDFVTEDGANDTPYIAGDGAVMGATEVTVETNTETETATETMDGSDEMTDTDETETMGDSDGMTDTDTTEDGMDDASNEEAPGFGAVLALVAIVAAALLARRR